MTRWALSLASTVRIGAGVWRKSQTRSNAATPVEQAHATLCGRNPFVKEEKGKALKRHK
jgi:hypothetical protein